MNAYAKFLAAWMRFVHHNAWAVMLVALLFTGVAGWYTATNLKINSDLRDLIKQDAQWRLDYDDIRAAFPQFVDNATIAVYGDSLGEVEDVTEQLRDKLLAVDDLFEFVYAPQVDPFFKEHALLFLDEERLSEVIDQLAEMQPALTALSEDPSLRGLFDLLQTGLENIDDETLPAGFTELLNIVAAASEDVVAGKPAQVNWGDRFLAEDDADTLQFRLIYVKGKQNLDQALPHKELVLKLRETIAALDLPPTSNVKIGVTGEVPLAHEEIEAARNGAQQAGILSLILLAIILGFGVRNWRVIVAIYASLLIGLVWTAAYAVAAVGEYNTLSVIFTVMFIGLGVDFAIHFCLRYQEALANHAAGLPALTDTSHSIGTAISLCGLTSAIGFAAFTPTDYVGLADLGVICAGGMVIALFCSFTLIPAIFSIIGAPTAHRDEHTGDLWFYKFWAQHGRQVVLILLVLSAIAAFIASRSQFDYSVLALKDPNSDSMSTHVVLQDNNVRTDYTLSALTTLDAAPQLAEQLQNLSVVEKVRMPADYIPDHQEEKLAALENATLFLWSALYPSTQQEPPTAEARLQSVQTLYTQLDAVREHQAMTGELKTAAERLLATLQKLLAASDSEQYATQLDTALVSEINTELDWLRTALETESFTFDDLPDALRTRLVSADGHALINILPAEDIVEVSALRRFINQVREVAPHAAGRPVAEQGVGDIVITAFQQAVLYASVCIFIILLITLRSLIDTIMVFTPLVLAAIFTAATAVLIDMPLNMANVLVLPLIFGLGVDNGIHVVERFRVEGSVDALLHSSTPRAVLLSTLTTIGTFFALSLSAHQGMHTIGVLLTIALGFLLFFTIVVLPVLLQWATHHVGQNKTAGLKPAVRHG